MSDGFEDMDHVLGEPEPIDQVENDLQTDTDSTSSSGSASDLTDHEVRLVQAILSNSSVRNFMGNFNSIFSPVSPSQRILEELTLDGVAKHIKSGKCKNVITMAGAGISTSAGIPDFRSPGSGLYDNLQKYNLPHPQAIFEIDFFRQNPQPFFALAKELYPGNFKPTVGHYFIKLLQDKGLLLRHYTQNIDTLERVAGVETSKIVEAHGSFHTSHCLVCSKEYDVHWMKEKIFKDEIPRCLVCTGIVKPDITFFGEKLNESFFKHSTEDFPKCDLLLIMGSSLVVQPFASLKDTVPNTCPRVLINRELVGETNVLYKSLGLNIGFDFNTETGTRDVFWAGSCDEGCELLAEKLGWKDELTELAQKDPDFVGQFKSMNLNGPSILPGTSGLNFTASIPASGSSSMRSTPNDVQEDEKMDV